MSLRKTLAHHRWAWGQSWAQHKQDAQSLGWRTVAALWRADHLPGFKKVQQLKLAGYPHPLSIRPGSSDAHVVRQVFARQEYDCVAHEQSVEYILDCGANIGCTSFFLLHRYPNAKVVVVEPDPGNMAMCKKNLAPFGDRVTFVQAGVWGESTPMVVDRGVYRDGAEWSFQVRAAKANETPDFQAKTIPDIIAAGGFPRVDLLKMDIEAAEVSVFRAHAEAWLPQVKTIVIELHGPSCEAALADALQGYSYTTDIRGELTVYRNLQTAGVPSCI